MNAFWTCPACRAVNDLPDAACEACSTPRPSQPLTPNHRRCDRCDEESNGTNIFHPDDGAPEDAGKRLCASCWIPALKRRAALDPISDHDRQRCMAEIKKLDLRWPVKVQL